MCWKVVKSLLVGVRSIVGTREKLYYEGKSSLSHIADPHLRIGDEKKPPTKIQHVKYEIWTSSSVLLGARKRLYNDGKSSFSHIALPILVSFQRKFLIEN